MDRELSEERGYPSGAEAICDALRDWTDPLTRFSEEALGDSAGSPELIRINRTQRG